MVKGQRCGCGVGRDPMSIVPPLPFGLHSLANAQSLHPHSRSLCSSLGPHGSFHSPIRPSWLIPFTIQPSLTPHSRSPHTDIRALFSTVSPLSSHEVDGVRKEKERLTDGSRRRELVGLECSDNPGTNSPRRARALRARPRGRASEGRVIMSPEGAYGRNGLSPRGEGNGAGTRAGWSERT